MSERTRTPADSARSMVSGNGSHSSSSVRSDEPSSSGAGGSGQLRQYGSPTASTGPAGARRRPARPARGRQRPAAAVGPTAREPRPPRAASARRGGWPAVDERRADAERGVVTVELERRGVGLDELDPILELSLPDEL